MNVPRISIVVPTFNQGHFIEQTLASIVGQGWPNLELIVIDGGSTDNTREVVERFRPHVAHFISEPDRGQADAINKGFRLATGDILGWLNSDDMFMPCTLARVARLLPDGAVPGLVYGGCIMFYEGKSQGRASLSQPHNSEELRSRDYIFQPSTFWTRALWENTGELNEKYHFVLDWDWFIRATEHCEFQHVPDFLSIYRFHPQHKTSSGDDRRKGEILEIIGRYADERWQAAYRDVHARLDRLVPGLEKLKRWGLYRFRFWIYRDLYGPHDFRVRVAIGQLRGSL